MAQVGAFCHVLLSSIAGSSYASSCHAESYRIWSAILGMDVPAIVPICKRHL